MSVFQASFQFSHIQISSNTLKVFKILLFMQYLEAVMNFRKGCDVILHSLRALCICLYVYVVQLYQPWHLSRNRDTYESHNFANIGPGKKKRIKFGNKAS